MNISFFIQPKIYVAHLYEDFTIRQGMETMKYHGYSAIPVLNRENEYLGTISEGDFLWTICNFETLDIMERSPVSLENLRIADINFRRNYPAVTIDTSMEELVERAMNQNFVPVVDDRNVFIGIITRKDIIKYLQSTALKKEE
ncbi:MULTISPECIES: CBS domain-containing protein [Eubacterium]|jgi:CBS domain-containing protein|uniref:CBS domain-containing protein n=1 Tax=Eubacterium ruminantium TaxID=42322 RepID=A0A1T4MCT2_9FIRM|nr:MULTISPECIES: CBS domain-containing protein [Eubacterium]MCR5368566.1 CBS domain-containing protein [Eubacterium sp.]SCW47113.1 CBS domain-containing protein [Eubacterium ruminantium]SDM54229.1 CBS domain-containing protein [Eubacterium ruminantium]SJZ64732.1 CBS domain-containing protein [Eubacterium ruminantium]